LQRHIETMLSRKILAGEAPGQQPGAGGFETVASWCSAFKRQSQQLKEGSMKSK